MSHPQCTEVHDDGEDAAIRHETAQIIIATPEWSGGVAGGVNSRLLEQRHSTREWSGGEFQAGTKA